GARPDHSISGNASLRCFGAAAPADIVDFWPMTGSRRSVARLPADQIVKPATARSIWHCGLFNRALFRPIQQREARHIARTPAVHCFTTDLADGIAPLLERQVRRRHLISSPAMRTFEDRHALTVCFQSRLRARANQEWLSQRMVLSRS